uniref:Cell morphogenesis protein (Cell morphogenesis protein PAG1) n=1 Tax=Ganoderma boninense TaxID=34458 RepID=A0A5K1K741_9APHY|nr:Cell morphogenesis protein (Cell morphogenesis protein PAG1) [Ganoderma boninense]
MIPSDTQRVDIKCVGVWDTVGSVYKQIDALNIIDTSLPATVKVALHAVSGQENRKKFLPTLWTIPSGGLKQGQVLKQVWFAGAHADLGGGYERHELADISLFWMVGEVESFINLDLDLLRSYAQIRPEPWGASQPHNAYKETSVAQQPIVGHETRLQSGLITSQSVFHPSLLYSPASAQLQSPDYMVTMNIITESFGSVSYSTLNQFEQYYPGKASPQSGNAFISFGGKEIKVPFTSNVVEVLVGHQSSVRWAPISGRLSLAQLGRAVPVPGGNEADKRVLYVVRAALHNGIHCGKVELGGHGKPTPLVAAVLGGQ